MSRTKYYPSGWELSAARASAVVRYLTDHWHLTYDAVLWRSSCPRLVHHTEAENVALGEVPRIRVGIHKLNVWSKLDHCERCSHDPRKSIPSALGSLTDSCECSTDSMELATYKTLTCLL